MGPIRLIRAIARLAWVARPLAHGGDQPIDPALLPLDLAEQGPSGLRLA